MASPLWFRKIDYQKKSGESQQERFPGLVGRGRISA